MDFGFECPDCGSELQSLENTRLVESMESRIDKLRDELNVETAEAEV
jgi:transcription initiation factor TFIIE subunit alpha